MEGNYPVSFGGKTVGKVQALRQGLYYRFICRCQLTGNVICRLTVQCGDKEANLGVVVPMGEGFGLDTKLPAKRLGMGEPVFYLGPKHRQEGVFAPIYPEEPFGYIEGLKDAFLAIQNGRPGAMLRDIKK